MWLDSDEVQPHLIPQQLSWGAHEELENKLGDYLKDLGFGVISGGNDVNILVSSNLD